MKKQNINLLKQEYVKPEIKSLQAELEQLLVDSLTLTSWTRTRRNGLPTPIPVAHTTLGNQHATRMS